MTWTEINKGNANWVSQEGFGNYLYGEVLYGQSESGTTWTNVSIGNTNWS